MRLLTRSGYRDVRRRGFLDAAAVSPGSIERVRTPSGQPFRTTYSRLYRENPWLLACVNLIARGLSRLPMHAFRIIDGDGNRERIRNDTPTVGAPSDAQRLDRLTSTPAPRTSFNELVRRTTVDWTVFGNAPWRKNRRNGKVDELRLVPWTTVVRVVREGDEIEHYETNDARGRREILLPIDVVHFGRGDAPDGVLGVSPPEPIARNLAIQHAIARHLVRA